jgi:hypothetical protein
MQRGDAIHLAQTGARTHAYCGYNRHEELPIEVTVISGTETLVHGYGAFPSRSAPKKSGVLNT